MSTLMLKPPIVRNDTMTYLPEWDNLLGNQVARALVERGGIQLRPVEVLTRKGCVCLRGSVPTYYLKQLAQSVAMSIEGVRSLENQIEIL